MTLDEILESKNRALSVVLKDKRHAKRQAAMSRYLANSRRQEVAQGRVAWAAYAHSLYTQRGAYQPMPGVVHQVPIKLHKTNGCCGLPR